VDCQRNSGTRIVSSAALLTCLALYALHRFAQIFLSGDIDPQQSDNNFDTCNAIGHSLAKTVQAIWDKTAVSDSLEIALKKIAYEFQPQATPMGLKLPVESYRSEINSIVFNKTHAFITIPGELSTVYDARLKHVGKELGFDHVSTLGLTNDAHGYIILPEAWRKKTFESKTSFGGENYGDEVEQKAISLLMELSGKKIEEIANER